MTDRHNTPARGIADRRPETFIGPSARWLADGEPLPDIDFQYDPAQGDGLILGEDATTGHLVSSKAQEHILTEAGSGAGKGISCVLPNALSYRGSMVILDPKGSAASISSRFRAGDMPDGRGGTMGLHQRVYVVDPAGITSDVCAPYRVGLNLSRNIHDQNPFLIEDAASLAGGLIVNSGEGESVHWADVARSFARCLLLHIGTHPAYAGRRHLGTFRDLMMLGVDLGDHDGKPLRGMQGLEVQMRENPLYAVQYGAAELFEKSDKELDSTLSSLRTQCQWQDFPSLRANVSCEDFAMEELRTAPSGCTVYLCLPPRYLDKNGASSATRWLRACIQDVLRVCTETPADRSKPPLLLLLDEQALIEPFSDLLTASSFLREYHVRIWSLLQTGAGQVDEKALSVYRSNAHVSQLWANGSDIKTLRFIQDWCGKTTIVTRRAGDVSADDVLKGRSGVSSTPEVVDLINMEEARREFGRSTLQQLILTQEGRPARNIQRIRYFDHDFFKGKYDPSNI